MQPDRAKFKRRVLDGPVTFAPLCLEPLVARLCEEIGFEAGYVGGGGLGFSLAVSEGLLSFSELASVTSTIVKRSDLPLIVDLGPGFGDPVHVTRAVREVEFAGAAAIEIEDQVAPKRVSHHRHVEHLVSVVEMVQKIEAAAAARADGDLLIIARTNAVANEGFDQAIDRGRAYHAAGADLVLLTPKTEEEWRSTPSRLGCPTAVFDPLHTRPRDQWTELGYNIVIDALTGQLLALETLRKAYTDQWTGAGGRDKAELVEMYNKLPALAGMDEFFEIESRTTEVEA